MHADNREKLMLHALGRAGLASCREQVKRP